MELIRKAATDLEENPWMEGEMSTPWGAGDEVEGGVSRASQGYDITAAMATVAATPAPSS